MNKTLQAVVAAVTFIIAVVALIVALGAGGATLGIFSVPTQGGVDMVSKTYGGTFDDAIVVDVPTANATGDAALLIDNDSVAESFVVRDAGTDSFVVLDGGDIEAKLIRYDTASQKLVCGTASFTATATVAHGLSTPTYAMCSIAGDADGASDFCTYANSSAVITLKGWTLTSGTPAAGAAEQDYAWCVIGTP